MQNKILTQSLSAFRIVLISSLTIFTLYTVQAWVSPTLSAPNGNVGGPLTTATSTQIKTGSLGLLDSLSIGKSLLVNGTTTSSGKITANGGFQLITGAASGTVLTSDTSGNASWQVSGGVTSLIAGTNITLSPVSGVGAVTVNAATSGHGPVWSSAYSVSIGWNGGAASYTHNLGYIPICEYTQTNGGVIISSITTTKINMHSGGSNDSGTIYCW